MELSRQMLLLTAVNYGSYYLHITKQIIQFAQLLYSITYKEGKKVQTHGVFLCGYATFYNCNSKYYGDNLLKMIIFDHKG